MKVHDSFCKNILGKNVEPEVCPKFKNVLRMFQGSHSNEHRNLVKLQEKWHMTTKLCDDVYHLIALTCI